MVARMWKGSTPVSKADAYYEYLKQTGIKDCRSIEGNKGVFVFRRDQGEVTDFLLLTLWDSNDSMKAFAGETPEVPRYYPGEREFLVSGESLVWHFELLTLLR